MLDIAPVLRPGQCSRGYGIEFYLGFSPQQLKI